MSVRLAHVWSSHFGASLGLPLIKPFADRGWDVTVFCPPGDSIHLLGQAGVKHVPIAISRRFVAPVRDLIGVSGLLAALRRGRFDLVHTHNIKVGWLARMAARMGTSARVVHSVHGRAFGDKASLPARLLEAQAEQTAARFCDRILVQSDGDAETFLRAGVPTSKLTFIGNGVSLTRFNPDIVSGRQVRAELGLGDEDVLFVSAGRLVRDKGFTELAHATAKAAKTKPRVRVAIAGQIDNASRQALSSSELADIETHVHLLGDREDMPAVIAAADVVSLVSHHEGLPRILMEGAAMAKPLLVTNASGCREVVNDPRGGILVPIGDVDALAEAMIDLASNAGKRRQMGSFNRNIAKRRFDIATVLTRLDRVYSELLG